MTVEFRMLLIPYCKMLFVALFAKIPYNLHFIMINVKRTAIGTNFVKFMGKFQKNSEKKLLYQNKRSLDHYRQLEDVIKIWKLQEFGADSVPVSFPNVLDVCCDEIGVDVYNVVEIVLVCCAMLLTLQLRSQLCILPTLHHQQHTSGKHNYIYAVQL